MALPRIVIAAFLLLPLAACGSGPRPDPRDKPDVPAISTSRTPMPERLSNNAVASITLNGRPFFYSFYGLGPEKTRQAISRRAFEYDVLDDKWNELPRVPVPEGALAAAAVGVRGKIYLFGGYTVAPDGAERSTPYVFMFDPERRAYTRLPDMPVPVDDSVALVHRDRYIYLVSGWHDDANVDAVQVFDILEREWFPATHFPGTPVFGHAGGSVGDRLLITDGVALRTEGERHFAAVKQSWLGSVSPDDPSVIEWERVADHPGPALYRAAGGGLDNHGWVVVAGGTANPYNYSGIGYNGEPSRPRDGVLVFDLSAREWIGAGTKRHPTMDHRALVTDGDQIYTIGGMGPGRTTTGAVIPVALGLQPAG